MDIFKDDKNNMETPTVHCDVKNCAYHKDNDICTAGKIKVGPNHAISSTDTVCDTFKPEAKL